MISNVVPISSRSPILLLVLGGLLVIAAACVSSLVVWNSHRQATVAAGTSMARSARLLEQGLTRSLEALDATLLRVTEPLASEGNLGDARKAALEALRFAPHLRQILVLDKTGQVVLDTARRQSPTEDGTVPDLAAWGLGAGTPRSLGSPLRIGTGVAGRYLTVSGRGAPPQNGRWIIPVDVAVEGGQWTVVAALNPDFFLRAFAAVLSGPVEEAVLVRYDGQVLAGHGEVPGTERPAWGWRVDLPLADIIHDGTLDRHALPTPLAGGDGTVALRLSEVYPVAVVLAYSDAGLRQAWFEDEKAAILTLGAAPILLGLLALVVLVLLRHRLHLRSELRVLSRVVEEAPVAVVVTDRRGCIEFVNDSFTRLLGYAPTEVIGRTPSLLRSGHTGDVVYAELWQTILAGGVWHGEFLNRARDGRLLWMSAAVSGVRDDDGQVRRFVAVEADVTERKRAESTMAAMVSRLETSNRELEQFARVASHDLQEPLRMVTGYLSLLQRRYDGLLPEEASSFIHNAVGGADRMRGLIKDLLAYSQVSNRQVSLRAVDADKALRTALDQLHDKIAATGASIQAETLPMVLAEDRNLSNLFLNLIDNALTYRHPERPPEVRISCAEAPRESFWEIVVADNGLGIEPRDHDRVFRLFQHLQSREEALGNGVGLAVARRIVERAGGAIRVESDGRSGSRFIVILSKAKSDDKALSPPEAGAPTPEATD